ncbi:hypothetical protein ACWEU6_02105 [Streptosporangium sandarakinum]|uniref:hypothetical protein n=1 Tax=Streptosporangium sandarakinum TaxID=1260955 RepID=UPI0036B9B988
MMRRSLAVSAALGLLFLPAAACGGRATTVPPGEPVSRTNVGLTEWRVGVRDPVLAPGRVALDVTNAGTTAHDLVVTGPGVSARTPVLPPGGTFVLRFTARPGTRLEFFCSVAGHDGMGMRTHARVAGVLAGAIGA